MRRGGGGRERKMLVGNLAEATAAAASLDLRGGRPVSQKAGFFFPDVSGCLCGEGAA